MYLGCFVELECSQIQGNDDHEPKAADDFQLLEPLSWEISKYVNIRQGSTYLLL